MARRLVAIAVTALASSVRFAEGSCRECAKDGSCSEAFKGAPGHYCGPYQDADCCCPHGAQCFVSPYFCQCLHIPTFIAPTPPPVGAVPEAKTVKQHEVLGIALVVILVWCILKRCRKKREMRRRAEYIHLSEVSRPQYVYASQPSWPTQPNYGSNQSQPPMYQHPPPNSGPSQQYAIYMPPPTSQQPLSYAQQALPTGDYGQRFNQSAYPTQQTSAIPMAIPVDTPPTTRSESKYI
ncbi:hypothetical protein SPRG_01831 [Saprolegnia parasitica CBS 223.65]|uniref:EGF-like domain-containing protein n=1 Tax=Saprolegnia parasitica (strain CBS 223.65) TaxID=695850 RepID=A0A067CUS4_SAPPC|nr:hypothetical protein SPRG_01831 [Saprolegnia parasitica CBS 223.65]KDO33015.1 hypothetical protein SPRG_01831 [Saprolegnia parasitica CBS 223.65]|eukprot:XP_012195789.1 hypothetical protein SPRG_01831 [Saprolegnia parasitica CBS 223.65]